MRKKTKTLLLIFISFGILIFILKKVDLSVLRPILAEAEISFLLLGIFLSLIQALFPVIKWHLLLKSKKIFINLQELFILHFIGLFISSFLPSHYSGDVYRTYVVAKSSGRAYDSAAAIVLQRVSGSFVLAIIGFFGAIFTSALLNFFKLTLSVAIICLIITLFIAIFLNKRVYIFFSKLFRALKLESLERLTQKFQIAILEYWDNKKLILNICVLSLFFYINAFLIIYSACLSVGLNVPFVYIIFVVPVIYLLEALPISINGLGIREGAFIFFFTQIGASYEKAFAVSIIVLFFRLFKSAIGGIFLIYRHSDIKLLRAKKEFK